MKPDPHHSRMHPDGTSRRQFLGGLATVAGLTAAGPRLAPTGRGSRAQGAASVTWDLTAISSSYTFGDGKTLDFYRLQNVAGGSLRGTLPYFEATEGDSVVINITNTLSIPIRPEVVGVASAATIAPGAQGSIAFTMPPAGTYLLGPYQAGSGGAPNLTHPVRVKAHVHGLSATLVSRPSSGLNELWNGGPTFDREYVLLYEDFDDRLQPAGTVRPAPYEPNYFTLNGMGFPDTVTDADTLIAGNLGERILLRTGNLGQWIQAPHFHGFHGEIAARNNVPETILPPKDTYPLPPRTTADVIVTASQLGMYPLHPHSLTMVTAGGLYPFGQLALIDIT